MLEAERIQDTVTDPAARRYKGGLALRDSFFGKLYTNASFSLVRDIQRRATPRRSDFLSLQLDGNACRLAVRHDVGAGDFRIDSTRDGFALPGVAADAAQAYSFNKTTFYEAGIERLQRRDHTEYRYTAASP